MCKCTFEFFNKNARGVNTSRIDRNNDNTGQKCKRCQINGFADDVDNGKEQHQLN